MVGSPFSQQPRVPLPKRKRVVVAVAVLGALAGGAYFASSKREGREDRAPHESVTRLNTRPGLRVTSQSPDIRLSVDGYAIGPLPQELSDLTPGDHVLAFDGGERYESQEQHVTLEAGKVQTLEPKLKVKKGLATVKQGQNAEGARVMLVGDGDERPVPVLPLRLELSTDKPWRLVATKKGYVNYDVPLQFEDGQAERTFVVDLENPTPCGCSTTDLECAMRCATKERTDQPQVLPVQEAASSAPTSFDGNAAAVALTAAATRVGDCKKKGGPSGVGRVLVTFAPSGRVTRADVEGAFSGTPIGACVAAIFRRLEIPPYSGVAVKVPRYFSIE